ncbi:TRAP transporter small permease [Robertmurraya korlensis]|uniref:TRAP transporter small permease n=1 Tax=Robertmurraya korlensis TaxID=519977 RepID=UPI002040469E|nr:TRAP transporter small permease [Robertmurraya korlensis]MCM3601227.1 TRAP transporter small permease [Robertmurraya korlensis]
MSKVLTRIEENILVFTFSVMCIIAFANVISRYFLNYSLAFTEEVTINLFVLLTFLGTSVGVRNHAHLGFTLIYDKANDMGKKFLCVFSSLITCALFILLTYYGVKMVQFQLMLNQTTPAMGWPQWVFTLAFPIGCCFCIFRVIESFIKEFKTLSMEGSERV